MRRWKKGCLLVVVFVVLGFVLSGLNTMYHPFVVTDPDDPRFDPKEFRFTNYSKFTNNEGGVRKALAKAFPPGTDKSFVDEILIGKAGARARKNQPLPNYHKPTDQSYSYKWSPSGMGGWVAVFLFDENNKSVMLKTDKRTIYGTDPTDTFWKEKENERK